MRYVALYLQDAPIWMTKWLAKIGIEWEPMQVAPALYQFCTDDTLHDLEELVADAVETDSQAILVEHQGPATVDRPEEAQRLAVSRLLADRREPADFSVELVKRVPGAWVVCFRSDDTYCSLAVVVDDHSGATVYRRYVDVPLEWLGG